MNKDFIKELEWRGMIHTVMPGAEEELQKGMASAYLGIDPTADSLHIGHLVGVMILKHFQMCGHRPIALIGGATGMIGDPSGKSQERNLLDEATLRHNQEAIKRQLSKLLDFESEAKNKAILVNNYDWMKDFSFLEFARDIGKCITVNYMMAKDSVKKRFNGDGDGMSFTEFTYRYSKATTSCTSTRPRAVSSNLAAPTSGATSPQARSLSAVSSAPRQRHLPSPAHLSRRLTARSLARQRAATYGSTLDTPRPTSSTSSGSM